MTEQVGPAQPLVWWPALEAVRRRRPGRPCGSFAMTGPASRRSLRRTPTRHAEPRQQAEQSGRGGEGCNGTSGVGRPNQARQLIAHETSRSQPMQRLRMGGAGGRGSHCEARQGPSPRSDNTYSSRPDQRPLGVESGPAAFGLYGGRPDVQSPASGFAGRRRSVLGLEAGDPHDGQGCDCRTGAAAPISMTPCSFATCVTL